MSRPKYTLEELIAQGDPSRPAPVLTEWEDMAPVGREIVAQRLIWLLGDVHGNFDHVLETVQSSGEQPAAVIFLGDLQCPVPFSECVREIESAGIECWAIPGNHDTDSERDYRNLFNDRLFQSRNLHGRVVEIAGIRVAGLGGIFRGQIWYPGTNEAPRHKKYDEFLADLNAYRPTRLRLRVSKADLRRVWDHFPREHQAELEQATRDGTIRHHLSSIFYDDWLHLYSQSADILVTHEAPDCHPHGFSVITSLAQALRVKFAFHGHHHDSLNYRPHDQRLGFEAHGVGFMGITDMFGGRLRVGEFDAPRQDRGQRRNE